MKTPVLFSAAALLFFTLAGHAEIYTIDPVHSTVGFKVRHLFSKVTGRFVGVTGTITADAQHPEASSVEATITTKSITTENEKRDTHLRSPDFFDVEKFSTITFKSKAVKKLSDDTADVLGDLTIHGVTKETTLHVKFLGKGKGMVGGETTGWEATTSIKRGDFGLTWSKAVEGVAVVGDDVDIEIEIDASRK